MGGENQAYRRRGQLDCGHREEQVPLYGVGRAQDQCLCVASLPEAAQGNKMRTEQVLYSMEDMLAPGP